MHALIPRVSIGLPVYNGERYLAKTLDAILAQTFSDFELVISDNASTDATEAICHSYAERDKRVRYSRNSENIGGSLNFQRVFDDSRAPYFKWASHDDLIAPTHVERCVHILDTHPSVVLCYPRSAFIDEHGREFFDHDDGCNLRSSRPSARVRQLLARESMYSFPVFGLIRQNTLCQTSLMAPYISSDHVLLLQLALLGEFYELPDRLFFFREHPGRSIRQFTTFGAYSGWFDPTKRSRVKLTRWRLVGEYLRSIYRAHLPMLEAGRCILSVLRWCRWHSGSLVRDIAMAAHQVWAYGLGVTPRQEIRELDPRDLYQREGPTLRARSGDATS